MADDTSVDALIADVTLARRRFMAALDDVEPALLTTPGLVGEWSARELVAHLGYWTEHATDAIHLARQGRLAEFLEGGFDVDARNETVARTARETDMTTVMQREEASFAALIGSLEEIDPALLAERLSDGRTLEEVVREDSGAHYSEHTADVRSWWAGADAPPGADDEDDDDEDEEDAAAGIDVLNRHDERHG